jgi:hypothetical protein
MNTHLEHRVNDMKRISEILIPYTYPMVSYGEEQEVLPLKQRVIKIDGYETVACYSLASYKKHILESLQIQSIYSPFLPFVVVCKLGRVFLGGEHLSYIEFFKEMRKIYCWTVKREDGIAVPPKKSVAGDYEGFKYRILNPGSAELR